MWSAVVLFFLSSPRVDGRQRVAFIIKTHFDIECWRGILYDNELLSGIRICFLSHFRWTWMWRHPDWLISIYLLNGYLDCQRSRNYYALQKWDFFARKLLCRCFNKKRLNRKSYLQMGWFNLLHSRNDPIQTNNREEKNDRSKEKKRFPCPRRSDTTALFLNIQRFKRVGLKWPHFSPSNHFNVKLYWHLKCIFAPQTPRIYSVRTTPVAPPPASTRMHFNRISHGPDVSPYDSLLKLAPFRKQKRIQFNITSTSFHLRFHQRSFNTSSTCEAAPPFPFITSNAKHKVFSRKGHHITTMCQSTTENNSRALWNGNFCNHLNSQLN